MFSSAIRHAPRRIVAGKLHLRPSSSRRFLSTAPPSQKSRGWKSSAARWMVAGAGVYYYNTSSVFAEQPDGAIARLDESIHLVQESDLPTVDALVEEKHRRQAAQQEEEAKATKAMAAQDAEIDETDGGSVEDLEEEAGQQGAFNPETGEINWDCPCLGGMAHGPCGPEFKEAFSCFVHSTEEPKGMECIEKFKGMQDCFREHPEMYGSELEDDEDELEEELRAETTARSTEGETVESSASKTSPVPASKVDVPEPQNKTEPQGTEPKQPTQTPSEEHVPKTTHDASTN